MLLLLSIARRCLGCCGRDATSFIVRYPSVGKRAPIFITLGRFLCVPCSQYIDDRHKGQLVTPLSCQWSDLQKAEAAAYIVTEILTSLGYTLALSKFCLAPTQIVRYLGFLCDSQCCENILFQPEIDLKSLQRFAGKITSFSIAVPAARLYTRACYRAIGAGSKVAYRPIKVVGDL